MGKTPTKLRPDAAETAYRVMLEATGQADKTPPPGERTTKNSEAVARGSKGGKKGGKARAEQLSAENRTAIARHAAQARFRRNPTS
jgi:hypothetical protein